MNIVQKIRLYGVAGCARKALALAMTRCGWYEWHVRWYRWRVRNAPRYNNPTPDELDQIERDLHSLGVEIFDYSPSPEDFHAFQAENHFPDNYLGGRNNKVWDEKLLEHWIASERLGLINFGAGDVYLDVAAASSPWAHAVRKFLGIEAYAIDLGQVSEAYKNLSYYRTENATATSFTDASVNGASLHCAYEMFIGNDDVQFVREVARILAPGGKVIILPLYMHTHYCAYSTPEYFGKGYIDPTAKEYVRLDCMGVPSSRKYNAAMLKSRVLDTIVMEGMSYSLLALRNKVELGEGIYCHFILEICR
jgi:ubiquinone/menaquinone biosynthesis C-methylase UbiE